MLPYWIGFASDAALAKKYQHLTFFSWESRLFTQLLAVQFFFFFFLLLFQPEMYSGCPSFYSTKTV